MIRSRHAARLLGLLAVAALLLAGCAGGGSGASDDRAATSVRLLLDWFPNPDHVGLYTALEQGYFADEGLDVTLTPPSNPADPLKLVAAGEVPLGISYEPDIIGAAAQGLHVTAVAAVVPVALNSLMATGKSPVDSPAQLAGRTVGTPGLPSDDLYLQQMYRKHGVDPSSVRQVNVGADLVSSMLSGTVDATVGGFRNIEAVQLRERGLNPTVVPVTEAGVPEYDELVLVANSDKLANDAEYRRTVRGFVAALGKGTATAIAQPAVGEQAVAKVAKGYDAKLLAAMVDTTTPLLENPDGFGHMDPAAWQSFAEWMRAMGSITTTPDVSTFVTNDYL